MFIDKPRILERDTQNIVIPYIGGFIRLYSGSTTRRYC